VLKQLDIILYYYYFFFKSCVNLTERRVHTTHDTFIYTYNKLVLFDLVISCYFLFLIDYFSKMHFTQAIIMLTYIILLRSLILTVLLGFDRSAPRRRIYSYNILKSFFLCWSVFIINIIFFLELCKYIH